MFTGIITHTTDVTSSQPDKKGLTLTFKKPGTWDDLRIGESVNTDGVCLTVAAIRKSTYDCYLMPETLSKTSFGKHVPKSVNLERALGAADRFGGHFVQGHVDGIGTVSRIDKSDGWRVYIDFAPEFRELVITKGSITVNGVSMTVAALDNTTLCIAVIPHTLEHTTLKSLVEGNVVNLEFDMIGKYIIGVMKIRDAEMEAHATSNKSK